MAMKEMARKDYHWRKLKLVHDIRLGLSRIMCIALLKVQKQNLQNNI